jgi:hypothetical protein
MADTFRVTWSGGPQSCRVWIYASNVASIRIDIRDIGHALQLVVSGPGPRRSAYDFPDAASLIEHHAAYEAHLLTQGFSLRDFVADRRRAKDSRSRRRRDAHNRVARSL